MCLCVYQKDKKDREREREIVKDIHHLLQTHGALISCEEITLNSLKDTLQSLQTTFVSGRVHK